MDFSRSLIAAVVLATAPSCAKDKPIPPFEPSPITPIEHGMPIGLTIPTSQLVTAIYEDDNCPSGWTVLADELARGEGNDFVVPLQEGYVLRFADLESMSAELLNAITVVGNDFSILSLDISWVCWVASPEWQDEMTQLVSDLQDAGVVVYLNLNHNGSFPADLADPDDLENAGWANGAFEESFLDYVQDVIASFEGILPAGTRVSLGQEPVVALFNGYLHHEGKYPPGGIRAGIAFTQALANLQKTFVLAAGMIADETDWMPTVGMNIRPLTDAIMSEAARRLKFVYNWALLDALVRGCIDENLDGTCDEQVEPPSRFEIGVTFYGTMSSSGDAVTIGESAAAGRIMVIPAIDVAPSAERFAEALQMVADEYSGILIAVAELGFSGANTSEQVGLFTEYLARMRSPDEPDDGRIPVSYVFLHTLFQAAEFGPGEWLFHLIDECLAADECVLTNFGVALLARL
ncbi:MAG: hypothetical protein A3C90_02910 [Candidatus Magasanikbacteria bacterium RIFCSPHIGHO2_02_FULL_51_14]|uniref:Glycoside hydrolase family 42 N-terminal domain-containing protein n=1 Tax=Candidatus Magasanikbacteria bacterium RIFCSPHIGHO2_02_FULL_51_14 TaxID=1798683 RepID=A0A1F6MGE0_9BACT|nr:MAG: hypothetical protein A3C90_02910 [Candidatus Magasanikbacteria bacterium RIFCSPHIGHO2_02_FULL_51_14]